MHDIVELSRLQFVATAIFHTLWSILIISLSLFVFALVALWRGTDDVVFYRHVRFCSRLLALNFSRPRGLWHFDGVRAGVQLGTLLALRRRVPMQHARLRGGDGLHAGSRLHRRDAVRLGPCFATYPPVMLAYTLYQYFVFRGRLMAQVQAEAT